MILTPEGIIEVSRYIHQNPIRTKIPLIQALEHYPYSSFKYYKNPQYAPVYLETSQLLQYFRLEEQRTYDYYVAYCLEMYRVDK